MSTSGTIGLTRIQTNKLLEKAMRRCGLTPQILTPEIVETALESLFMFLLSLSNRGLNLWCVDKQLIPLVSGKATYVLPTGTQDVLNLLYSAPTPVTEGRIVRFGVKFSSNPTLPFRLQKSDDGVVWENVNTYAAPITVGTYLWYDIDPSVSANFYQIDSNGVVESLLLSNNNKEIVVTPFNRDDYSNQPNKTFQSGFVTNYYFEKLVAPQITLWPVPNDDTKCLVLYRYRQIQDIGSLTQEIELPTRWLEAVSWHWAARLAFELPSIDDARRASVIQMAQTMTIEVEAGETDSAPVFLAPRIGVYTR